jgi:hypothetical protein
MSWTRTLRQIEAAQRKEQREAQRRQKALERKIKELEKLSELDQAKLEVEAYENQLEVLLSIHKEQGPVWEWRSLAASLPPPYPRRLGTREFEAKQTAMVAAPHLKEGLLKAVADACASDEHDYQEAVRLYAAQLVEHKNTARLAHRIVSGDVKAYAEAIGELSPFAEISQLGSAVRFTIHTPKLIECGLKVNGSQVIPAETKSLTAAGKLTVKTTPRARFHEVYQDYVCGCVLRVAREIFALLPVEVVLVTATVDATNAATGQTAEQPVMSVVIPRPALARLDFDRLDPSDTVETFFHRGDFKATRKSEAFLPIVPLNPADLLVESEKQSPFATLFTQAQQFRTGIQALAQKWTPAASETEEMTS